MAAGFIVLLFCAFSVSLLVTTTVCAPLDNWTDTGRANGSYSGMLDARSGEVYVIPAMNQEMAMNETCRLHAWSAQVAGDVVAAVKARGVHLLLYTLSFPEYMRDPLANMSRHQAAHHWQRAFTRHGHALLSLGFNFETVSLGLLSFGVERMSVKLVDAPYRCFGQQTEAAKIAIVQALLMTDFRSEPEMASDNDDLWSDAANYVCHTTLAADDDGRAIFMPECCTRNVDTGNADCAEVKPDTWIKVLFWMIVAVKVTFLLFGPLLLQKWIFTGSIRLQYYVVRLKERMRKTILVKKAFMADDSQWADTSGRQKKTRHFRNFRRLVKTLPSEEIVPIVFHSLHVQVDERRLMSEREPPVGLKHFLYTQLLRCGVVQHEPFASCCRESILGSCAPRFLWLRLMKRSDCNVTCRKCMSWGHVVRLIGGIVVMVMVPLPYYIRVLVFYLYEESEIEERRSTIERLNLKVPYDVRSLFQYITPTHSLLVGMYLAYVTSYTVLAACRSGSRARFDSFVFGCVQDLRSVSRVECLRLLVAHLLLPIEKFGVVFGIVIGAIYWPIALPLCMLVAVCYGVPTLYLSGRVFVHVRPAFMRAQTPTAHVTNADDDDARRTLSRGVTSFESCMLLENIVPPPSYGRPSPTPSARCSSRRSCRADLKAVACSVFRSVVLGFACLLFLFPLLVMYAEAAGFAAEVCALSLIGAIVNASNAAKYVVLAFWVVTYTANCYNTAYAKYVQLSGAVFSFIKRKLDDDVRVVTLLRERYQKNTAFKYFTSVELVAATRLEAEVNSCTDDNNDATTAQRETAHAPENSIEYVDGKLHWRVTDLVLFVDRKDVPRMPVALFERICEIDAPGCPGPVSSSLLRATVQLGYMLAFLVFVFAVVVTFGSAYSVSATNQLLVTLAGGLLPFVVRFVLTVRQVELDLNSYTFEGRIHNIMREFSQAWPVYDLSFERDVEFDVQPEAAESGGISSGACNTSQVDLLITVREDFENVRSASQQEQPATRYNGPKPETPGGVETHTPNARNWSRTAETQSRGATCRQLSASGESVANIDRAADVRPRPLRDIARQQADIMVVSDDHGAHAHSEVYRSNSMTMTCIESSSNAVASRDTEDESAL